ncbi:hypothetical protein ONR57_12975 [Hoyosella sp. YIM 151337]|uniref:sensor histidine kinase n=1 Tax=Hoyosella sp. YIM 151337 TaxID=2992742 RepID=UPI002235B88C|nr:ATP-binding protein [Hoyosella sp. YIM 151337]MCW4354213.1 hypothetical protein [Hoyosella sp. YIM 151337]
MHKKFEAGAAEKLARTFAQFIGWGAVFFAIMTAPHVASQVALNPWWWTPLFAVLTFGTAIALIPISLWGSLKALRVTINAFAVANVLTSTSWLLTWTGETLPSNAGTWFSYFPGLAAVAGAIIWRLSFTAAYVAVVVPTGVYTGYVARSSETGLAAPLLSTTLQVLLFAVTVFALARAGRILDETAVATRLQVVQTSVAKARTAEQRRVNAFVHDGVMSTLIAGARNLTSAELARQAATTLAELDRASEEEIGNEEVSATQFLGNLRATIVEIKESARLLVAASSQECSASIPVTVGRAFCAGMAEALRNVQRHAGVCAVCEVQVFLGTEVRIDVVDNGVGFDTESASEFRLGVRASILDRFAQLEGARAVVHSEPGRGTRVTMSWTP